MAADFDADAIAAKGWRQGAVLGPHLRALAWGAAPKSVAPDDASWLIVTSHDCDVVNPRLEREPFVEIIRAVVVQKKADAGQTWGRNPRTLQLELADSTGATTVLALNVHERWPMERHALMDEAPIHQLPDKSRRLVAEWLAKRYIRAAFPGAFDARWRSELGRWAKVMRNHSAWIQGVYLRLNTLDELPDELPYKVDIIVAAPHDVAQNIEWASRRSTIENDITTFWEKFSPGIELEDVSVTTTDDLTLAELEPYQRFDLDWVSFSDDTAAPPVALDMNT